MDLLKFSILIFIPYMFLVAYLFMGPDFAVLDGMGLKLEDEHPASYRLNGLKEGLLCVCFYIPAFYYNIYEMMYTTGLGRSTVPFWLTLIVVMYGAPLRVLQGGALDLPCGLLTIYAYFSHGEKPSETFANRNSSSINLKWIRFFVQLSGFLEGVYGLLLVFAPEVVDKVVFDLQYSNQATHHLGLRSYGICTLVIGMFYIYWSIPSMCLQHMYGFVGMYHLMLALGLTIFANNEIYPVPLSCLYVERTFHGLFGMLICILFVLRPYKNVTIFQNGHLVPHPKLGEAESGISPKELKKD